MPTIRKVNEAIQKGISYILRLYKPEIGLIGSHPKIIGGKVVPSDEYAVRHINALAWKVLMTTNLKTSEQIRSRVEHLGFTGDLYDPLFGMTYDTPYDPKLYLDCYSSVRKHLPCGPTFYPYRSAVFLVTPLIYANIINRLDPLGWSLEILNDHWSGRNVDLTKLRRCGFDGHGIRGGLMQFYMPSAYTTARLAVYLATNASVGRTGVADACVKILLQLQSNQDEHRGGFYRAYEPLDHSYTCMVPTRHRLFKYSPSFIRKRLSTPEVPTAEILTDAESTLISVAALQLYERMRNDTC